MVKISEIINEDCWIIYYKKYCKWILGKLVYESTGGPGSVDFDWEKVIRNRESIIGFNHTHPCSGMKGPSSLDDFTMSGWVKALGKSLICGIKSDKQRFYIYERGSNGKIYCRTLPFIMVSNRILAKIG